MRTLFYMPRPPYLQSILHSTYPDHRISKAYSILHAPTTISPTHTSFYIPRPPYLQRLLHSTWPNHHISNAYFLLYAPFISTPFSTHRNDSHFAPSSLSSYFPLLRYKHSCQHLFSHFSLCVNSDSQTPHARLTSHLIAGLCSVSILAEKTSQHNMQT
jgi:hypothetical protein